MLKTVSSLKIPALPSYYSASRWLRAIAAIGLLLAGSAHAQQADSMEERLRAQLRATTAQLQEAQNELATLKAGKTSGAAPSDEVAALKQELAQSKAELEKERRARSQATAGNQQLQEQANSFVEKANAQIAQYRSAYENLLKMARASEAERQRLAGEAAGQSAAIQQCEAKNGELYALGNEILRAYETVDFGDVLSSRQPFAAKARAKYEEIAQGYGDKLYQGQFDARAVAPPVAAAAPANAPVEAARPQ